MLTDQIYPRNLRRFNLLSNSRIDGFFLRNRILFLLSLSLFLSLFFLFTLDLGDTG